MQWNWQTSSEKLGEGRYALRFSTSVPNGMLLYEPGQDVADLSSALIQFSDSTIIYSPIQIKEGSSKNISSSIFEGKQFKVLEGKIIWETTINLGKEVPASLIGSIQFTYGNDLEFYPLESYPFDIKLEGGKGSDFQMRLEPSKINDPINACGTSGEKTETGLLTIFFLGFLGGLIALLTPCVFPMIPLTVSFFTKKADSRKGAINAVLYGFFIFLIYIVFSLPFHLIGKVSPTIYNDISTNIWLNLSFFLVFVAFAIYFFGYYEITLPSGLANSANARQGSNL
ncbi:MAG: cytochrome c biogenesis protein CcdA, partial [Chitinophagaceae bacterium]